MKALNTLGDSMLVAGVVGVPMFFVLLLTIGPVQDAFSGLDSMLDQVAQYQFVCALLTLPFLYLYSPLSQSTDTAFSQHIAAFMGYFSTFWRCKQRRDLKFHLNHMLLNLKYMVPFASVAGYHDTARSLTDFLKWNQLCERVQVSDLQCILKTLASYSSILQ